MDRRTRDCAELQTYISRFKKSNIDLIYKEGTHKTTMGVVETKDGKHYFCALMYRGDVFRKSFIRKSNGQIATWNKMIRR